MAKDPGQNVNPQSTLPMLDERLVVRQNRGPDEPAFFEYPSSSSGQSQASPHYSYPPPAYRHYPYPPPSYLSPSQHPQPTGQAYPSYGYPLPLGTAIKQLPKQYLRVLIKPGAAIFAQEKQKAVWNIILVQLVLIGVVGALTYFVDYAFVVPALFSQLHISKIASMDIATLYSDKALEGSLTGFFSAPIGVFVFWMISYFIAKGFKGRGTFIEYIYCCALFYLPIQILSGLLGLIPLAGFVISYLLPIILATLFLTFVNMAVHKLSASKAALAALILPASGAVLVILFFLLIFLILIPILVSHA